MLTLDMFRLPAMVCFGCCFCMRTVGACNFIGLASLCTFFWSRSLKVFLDGLLVEAARLFDVVNLQEQVQTMLEDALADIRPTLGLLCVIRYACGITTGVLKVRTVVCFGVCKFSKQLLVEGWLDKGDACSPPQQLFGAIVQRHCVPASFFK